MNVYLNGNLAKVPIIHINDLLTLKKATLILASTFFFFFFFFFLIFVIYLHGCKQSNPHHDNVLTY